MLGSTALETAIGLALMFFVIATAASAIMELYSAMLNKRSKNLQTALMGMLNTGEVGGPEQITNAQVRKILKHATGSTSSAYLSANAFADAATELVAKGQNIGNLQTKMERLARESRGQLTLVKAGLETWFDDTMAVARQQYSKFATLFLLVTGLVLAVALNASTIDVARDLWTDSAARQAVVAAAGTAEAATAECDAEGSALEQANCAVATVSAFQLPIGWGPEARAAVDAAWWISHIAGWLLTGLLVMLGAPFWFDLLNRLVSLRANGAPPPSAGKDPASSVTMARATGTDVSPIVLMPTSAQPHMGLNAVRSDSSIELRALSPEEAEAANWLGIALNRDLDR